MSVQSEAAMKHIEKLLELEYCQVPISASEMKQNGGCFKNSKIRSIQKIMIDGGQKAFKEYYFTEELQTRFDYAVPSVLCANPEGSFFLLPEPPAFWGEIEIDGSTFVPNTGHNTGTGLRAWREKNNAAMTAGWRVFHYAPEEIIKAGRKVVSSRRVQTSHVDIMRNPAR